MLRSLTVRSLAIAATAVLWGAASVASATAAPLPHSDYAARPVCSAPTPGRATCLALELEARTSAARARTRSPAHHGSASAGLAKVSECTEGYSSTCVTPSGLRGAYFPGEEPESPTSEPQTIALVDAYNDPKAQADLETYEKEFALDKCSAAASACFEQVNQNGEAANLPFPTSEAVREAELSVCESPHSTKRTVEACENVVQAESWAVETSTDIEVARAICQNCKILLVEADSANYPDLEEAEDTAAAHATEISNSWGSEEPLIDSPAFNHPGVVITASSGDNGYLNWTEAVEAQEATLHGEHTGYFAGADYPASSPHVVAVGGTRLNLNGLAWQSESVWNDDPGAPAENYGAGGSGCSRRLEAQIWQLEVPDWSTVGCSDRRAVADVSADADPYTGVAVYDSMPDFQAGEHEGEVINTPPHWEPIGGTSVASPIIAAMFALAGGAHGVAYPAKTLYAHLDSPLLHDVTSGGNGECDANYSACSGSLSSPFDCGAGAWICDATTGYDGPTGVGTPDGIGAFKAIEGEPKGKAPGNEPEEEPQVSGGPNAPGGTGTTGGGASPDSTGGSTGKAAANPLEAPVTVSALALTASARTALRHSRLRVSQLAFSCVLSRAATVRVTLAARIRIDGHTRWRTLSPSPAFIAIKGFNRRRLHSLTVLAAGVYRLTLTPSGGAARSIQFRVF